MAVRPHPLDDSRLEAPRHAAPPRPALRLVAPPSGRPGMAFVVLSALVVGALVLGLVVLNVLVAQKSFHVSDLEKAVQQEEERSQQLRYAVATADSPEAIAEAAQRLGLVAPEHQDFLVKPVEGGK
jgi:cell division protein FtsL